MVRHRRGHVGRSNGGLLRDRPSSLSPHPRATDPRCHGRQEYGGIEYGGLPVIAWIALPLHAEPCGSSTTFVWCFSWFRSGCGRVPQSDRITDEHRQLRVRPVRRDLDHPGGMACRGVTTCGDGVHGRRHLLPHARSDFGRRCWAASSSCRSSPPRG
jgi:hypothetical protein